MMNEEKRYYAKSANAHHGKILVKEHLERVGALAAEFGAEIGMPEAARLAGDFHDFGKYSDRFQGVLDGTAQRVDHALPGAAFLYQQKGLDGKRGYPVWTRYAPVLEAIQGHHDGLLSLESLAGALRETMTTEGADACPSGKQPSLSGQPQLRAAAQAFLRDRPGYSCPHLPDRPAEREPVAAMLDTRMLFSCLVDADYSVSAQEDDPDYLCRSSGGVLDAPAALERLLAYRAGLQRTSAADLTLNRLRDRVFEACGEAGALPPGLFTLTAPTGVGKTVAMLHFALRHCVAHGLRRIIVVLPFLALAEQTEAVYRHIFPEILVDHSQRELPDEMRQLAARWDAPVVITTSVRFFESLFADRPTDCRKLHNIAGSLVLFDEAQSLPAELAGATVRAVDALCRKYRCTMVFSTATQPDFSALPEAPWHPTELLPDNRALFAETRRVQVQWRLPKNGAAAMPLTAVAEELAAHTNAACVVNLRRHARTLFLALRQRLATDEGLFLLTTDLCPGHRLAAVEAIKARQRAGLPCRVVATQCIEAGVDLDFAVLYRALAPLEAIIQAAGRCNRNGRLPQGGRVVVFEPQEAGRLYPGDSYGAGAQIVKALWAEGGDPDLNSPQLVAAYYRRFFARGVRNGALENALCDKDYPETARQYRLIRNAGVRLIVPWAGQAALFHQLRQAELAGGVPAALLRAAAPITITCFDEEAVRACASPLFLWRRGERTESGYYLLNTGYEQAYDPLMGFCPGGDMTDLLMG